MKNIKNEFINGLAKGVGISVAIIAVGIITVFAATWSDSNTSGGQMSATGWNALVNNLNLKCGAFCATSSSGALSVGGQLTSSNWNSFVQMFADTFDNNTNLVAGNIKSGVSLYGVNGSLSAPNLKYVYNGSNCSANGDTILHNCGNSVTMTTNGSAVNISAVGGTYANVGEQIFVKLLRDGAIIVSSPFYESACNATACVGSFRLSYSDAAPAGSHVYQLQISSRFGAYVSLDYFNMTVDNP